MENIAFAPVSFADFSAAVVAAGYTPVQYSGTGYYVKAKNGIRVEFQNTKDGQFGVGYTNPVNKVAAVFDALQANPVDGLVYINRITRSFNYRATDVAGFLKLVDAVGAVKLPASAREVNAATPVAAKPQKPVYKVADARRVDPASDAGKAIASDALASIALIESKTKKRA